MTENAQVRRCLLLDEGDSVVVLSEDVEAGDVVLIDQRRVALEQPLTMGHKVARHPIAKGQSVKKYGAPIGTAAMDIALGEHVHLHNLVSAYTTIEDMKQ